MYQTLIVAVTFILAIFKIASATILVSVSVKVISNKRLNAFIVAGFRTLLGYAFSSNKIQCSG